MTRSQFRKTAERMFLNANPSAVIVGWIAEPRRVEYPTGVVGMLGRFQAVATGHAPKIMIADWDNRSGFSVR